MQCILAIAGEWYTSTSVYVEEACVVSYQSSTLSVGKVCFRVRVAVLP